VGAAAIRGIGGIVTLVALCSGCGTTFGPVKPYPSKKNPVVTQEDMRCHVIHVDRDGDFYEIPDRIRGRDQPIDCRIAEKRDLQAQREAMKKAYTGIFKGIDSFATNRLDQSGPLTVTIIIHGGLMHPGKKLSDELEMLAMMREDDVYPVFINWLSGPMTTLTDHFFRIRSGEVSESKVTYVTAYPYMGLYLLKTIGEAPLAWWRSLKYYYKGTIQPVMVNASAPEGWNTANRFHEPDSQNYRYKWSEAPIYLIGLPSRIILTPLIYSWGTPAWKGMERRTHAMFVRQKDFDPDRDASVREEWNGTESAFIAHAQYSDNAYGAVYYFCSMFAEEIRSRQTDGQEDAWDGLRINLIGYSMGGIAANHILKTTPDLPIANIVYIASADNLQNYLDIPVEYVRAKARAGETVRVYNLFLHPKNDNTELNYASMVPPGSLLTWIDHTYESPEYVLQRTAGRWENMRSVVKLIPDEGLEDHFHYKVFGRNKSNRDQPQRHIEFDKARYRYWREEFWR
jgi:hypothetical protein